MKYTIFGESHGVGIGVVLTDVPANIPLDWDFINSEMARRAPGQSAMTTARKEADAVEILSGVVDNVTCGTPVCAVIRNGDTRSRDYGKLKDVPRPSHGDFAGSIRYDRANDIRGGGHFSGRLTAPLVFAGAIAKLELLHCGIGVTSEITKVAGISHPTPEELEGAILAAKDDCDSVGGQITVTVEGLPVGCGQPDFGCNVEGIFSQHFFGIPAVKAVEFGLGTGFADVRGSVANDPFYWDDGMVRTRTNHSGGINGGITNGMPVVATLTFRPTPSIARPQETVNLATGESEMLTIEGRHDPCILPRALPVVEAAAALAALEVLRSD